MGVNEHQEVSLVFKPSKPVEIGLDSLGAIVSTFELPGDAVQLGITTIRYDTPMIKITSYSGIVIMKMLLEGPFNNIRSEFTPKAAPRQEDSQKGKIVPVNEFLSYRISAYGVLIRLDEQRY
jgi:hypothetical protein